MCQRRTSKYEDIIFAVLLLIGFSFIIGRFTSTVNFIKNFIYYFSYSNLSLVNYVFHSVENLADSIKTIVHVRRKNIVYKQKNKELADKLRNYKAVVEDYDNLSKLLKLAKIKNFVSVFARISVRDPSKWYQWFIIDKGNMDGLYNELPVVMFNKKKGAFCAVGRIMETYSSSSKVALITNAFCALPVEIKGKGINCLAEGFNSSLLKITYIPCDTDVKAGDEIVVSELSSVFPKGTPVGIINEVLGEPYIDFKTATAKVFFEIDNVYKTVVLMPEVET
ncbi:MAG: rod shape-determining protein MreC [Endomicrobium sp.]|jgi:rod shape-determining protein MreC|nr:rod shape-determining protein MreC [Endomicrobium sp.]